MIRSAADFNTPNGGASTATSRARSSSGRLHGRPLRTASAPSRRNTVTSFPNCRGLSPVNGTIQTPQGPNSSSRTLAAAV